VEFKIVKITVYNAFMKSFLRYRASLYLSDNSVSLRAIVTVM